MNMRDPDRIPRICEKLKLLWEKHPDLRLGQLVENVKTFGKCRPIPTFYIEDASFEELLDARLALGWKDEV